MRFRLRTLLIVLALGPPVLAAVCLYPALFGFVGGLIAYNLLAFGLLVAVGSAIEFAGWLVIRR